MDCCLVVCLFCVYVECDCADEDVVLMIWTNDVVFDCGFVVLCDGLGVCWKFG